MDGFPAPMGVLYSAERPSYEDEMEQQIIMSKAQKGEGDLEKLLFSGNTWVIE